MHSQTKQEIATPEKNRKVRFVGEGLVAQATCQATERHLNGNRNFRGKFNIDVEAMKRDLEAQGRADRAMLKP